MTMIAYVGPDLPQDLLAATGASAAPLSWNVDRAMPAADRWLESKFPLWARSILQDWSDGVLDGLDAVIFSRADDAAQRLYYYLCELRLQGVIRGPEPLIFDVAKIARPSSGMHMTTAVRKLADRLDVDCEALERGIVETNARRAAAAPAGVGGSVCLLSGTPPPDGRLHAMIEKAGWHAAGLTLAESWRHLGEPVAAASGDPFAAVARQLHAAPHGSRAFFDRAAAVVAAAAAAQAGAALLWFAEEDEARIWHLPAERDALARAGVPTLILTRRDWRANDGAAEEIASFLKELSA